MFKVNNRNTRTWREICSKLTIKSPERRHWCRSGVFIVNFEHILHPVLVLLLLTLSRQMPTGCTRRMIASTRLILNCTIVRLTSFKYNDFFVISSYFVLMLSFDSMLSTICCKILESIEMRGSIEKNGLKRNALHDLVPFVQIKKGEKHPWRNVTLGCFSRFFTLN